MIDEWVCFCSEVQFYSYHGIVRDTIYDGATPQSDKGHLSQR